MKYLAKELTDFTVEQVDTLGEIKREDFERTKYEYPLIFLKQSYSIIFFNMVVKLNPMQYGLLYLLVKNATTDFNKKGISPVKLFELLECRHTRKKSNNANYNIENEEYLRADERIRTIKKCVIKAIKSKYAKLEEDFKKEKEQEIIKNNEFVENFENMINDELNKTSKILRSNEEQLIKVSPLDIYECGSGFKIDKFFGNSLDVPILDNNPYYYFEITSALKHLIYNQKDKDYKYSTDFTFTE